MAINKPAKAKADETPKAVLPKSDAPVPEGYWTQVPKSNDEYLKIITRATDQINKAFKDSGFSVYTRKAQRFTDAGSAIYLEKIFLFLEASYWSYGRNAPKEAIQYVIDHFNLNDQTAKLKEDRQGIEFMFEGVYIILDNPNPRMRQNGGYSDSITTNLVFGYEGEVHKVLKILFNKFGFDLTEYGKAQFKLMEGDSIYKEYDVASGYETLMKILGTSMRNGPYQLNFTRRNEFVNWLMSSRYIGKSTFDIDANNNYTGPADYYGSSLYRELVHLIRRDYVSIEDKATPEVLPETIRKYQNKYWESANLHSYKKMQGDLGMYQEHKLMRAKFPDTLIIEVAGIDSKEEINFFRKNFESHISDKEDFSFFLLSSSEDTIRERVAAFRGRN